MKIGCHARSHHLCFLISLGATAALCYSCVGGTLLCFLEFLDSLPLWRNLSPLFQHRVFKVGDSEN